MQSRALVLTFFLRLLMKTISTYPFDPSVYLSDAETAREYLQVVMAEGDANEIVQAFGDAVRAQGVAKIARASGMHSESLYKVFSGGTKPRFETILRVSRALGVPLSVAGAEPEPKPET